MHLTSARIFFQDYLYFAVCLHEFFFSDVMAARIFFPGICLCTNFLGGIFTPPPPPGISNGPPLKTGLNNVVLLTLFTVVNNVEQYCYTRFRLNNIVQYC